MIAEKYVDDFLSHHGVKGMIPGFPKTNLDRISRMARGTAAKKTKIADIRKEKVDFVPSIDKFLEGLLSTKLTAI